MTYYLKSGHISRQQRGSEGLDSKYVLSCTGLQGGWFHLLVQKYKKSCKFQFCRRHKMPASAQVLPLPFPALPYAPQRFCS